MAVNRDKPDLWKQDIAQSVDMCNDWFVRFAPLACRTVLYAKLHSKNVIVRRAPNGDGNV